ncbi:DUF1801 domain-containing protein [Candidatus Dojkabacteria bacterium]|uniref:DUF1801 domain-containing protein n=1 Tax=Candidatus Dojkabacteria bacterium TaxID=2099670 RepID=A0A955LAC8_9BACT|nr:DUF1801 domain-containing protein [Candidatus Dojkabacteria bacterium]
MNQEIKEYNSKLEDGDKKIANLLAKIIDTNLRKSENKIWHGHPVWFLEGNPIVGYSKQKEHVRLLFWSGMDFGEADLKPGSGKFKDAHIDYIDADQINEADIKRWLKKSEEIQWDYKNIVKRKGELLRLK